MKTTQRRTLLAVLIVGAGLTAAYAYYLSLVPATHPDHDHGILNLDAGGHLLVTTRDGKTRNLVGAPGHPLVLHFFSPAVDGAAAELAGLFEFQKQVPPDANVEFVLVARAPDFGSLDAWMAASKLVPPTPQTVVLDPKGETTEKLNSKRPLETMFFNAEGKLAAQARGRLDWGMDALAQLNQARQGATIE